MQIIFEKKEVSPSGRPIRYAAAPSAASLHFSCWRLRRIALSGAVQNALSEAFFGPSAESVRRNKIKKFKN